MPPGASARTGLFTLTRNVTVTAAGYPDISYHDWYPTLDWTAVT